MRHGSSIRLQDCLGACAKWLVADALVVDWCPGGLREQDWQAQLAALEQSLRASQAEWKVIVGHHPPRTNGHHNNTEELMQHLEPLMQVRRRQGCACFGSPSPTAAPCLLSCSAAKPATRGLVPGTCRCMVTLWGLIQVWRV